MRTAITTTLVAPALLLPLPAMSQDTTLPAFVPAEPCLVDVTVDLPVDCGYIDVPA